MIYKDYEIRLRDCQDPMRPDETGDDSCFLVFTHRQFEVQRKGFDPRKIYEHIKKTKTWFYNGYYVFELFAYIHSGVTLALHFIGDEWDTSNTGFVLVKKMPKWSYHRLQAEEIAKSVVREWDQYLNGDCFNCSIWKDDDIVESIGIGYFEDELIEEAKMIIDGYVNTLS